MQDILSLTPNKLSLDPSSYNTLIYSEPGMGKTEFAVKMAGERHLILGAEYGFKGIPGAIGVSVPDYLTLSNYVSQLDTEEARLKFDTLIIDTTTKIGEIITNFILSKFGKDFMGDCKQHGGAYPLINRYYDLLFNRLKARGYNFIYLCHAGKEPVNKKEGDKDIWLYDRYFPKMNDRLSTLITPEVDYVFFITKDKEDKRIIITDTTKKNYAKRRTNLPLSMPLDIDIFKEEFAKGIKEKGGDMVTNERSSTTVLDGNIEKENFKDVVNEIKILGRELREAGFGNEAIEINNLALGTDDNGVQRKLDAMTQNNIEMLKKLRFDLQELKNNKIK